MGCKFLRRKVIVIIIFFSYFFLYFVVPKKYTILLCVSEHNRALTADVKEIERIHRNMKHKHARSNIFLEKS